MLTHRFRTILGDIPEDWEGKSVRSVIINQFAGDWGNDEGEEAILVIRSTNFTNNGSLNMSNVALRYFPKDKADQFSLKAGDVLVERSGGGPEQPVGRIGFIKREMPGTTVSNFVQVLRPDPDKVDAEFLGWVLFELQRMGIVERVQQQSTQMRNLNWRDYQQLLLPWPNVTEQRPIAAGLNLADDAINMARNELNAARILKISLEVELLACKTGEQGRNKIVTRILPLKELANIGSGVTLNQDRAPKENACRYLTVAHVQRGEIANDSDVRFLELTPKERETRLLKDGDLLVVEGHASSMEIGRAAMFQDKSGEPTTYQNHLFRVRADEEQILPKFLLYVLNSERIQRHWNAICNTSSGLNTINRRNLRNLPIQCPNLDKQRDIIEILDMSKANIVSIAQKVAALEEVKRSLLQNLLTGKIRIPPTIEIP
jgi:type I restriction enzyme S subunit